MAARIRSLTLTDDWRAKIRTSELINRLQEHVLGSARMLPTQLKAIEILLRKTIPDLSQVDGSLNIVTQPEARVYPVVPDEHHQLPALCETMDSVH